MSKTMQEFLNAARAEVPTISREEVKALMGKHDVVILDVRDASEVAASGKVKGAINISRGLIEFKADPESPYYAPELKPEKTIITYCASGGRSALAGKTLKEMGYNKVFNLGKFQEWKDAGGEVE
ncbi:MAG: rhodanese-like domain-containing protein [Alphaproteobacteria bacterium]|nr:rhodanese-like domain-containing protein [Alphaproteobacteria bacterium]